MEYNCYLPKLESQFMHHVRDELETYQEKGTRNCVLLFPPLPSRLRYLIHSLTDDVPEFDSFSVGEKSCRRVVVCHSELRGEIEEDTDTESDHRSCETPHGCGSRQDESKAKSRSSTPSQSRGPKRPDKPLYVPRAARQRLSVENSQGVSGDKGLAGPGSSGPGSVSPSSDSGPGPETAETAEPSSTVARECLPSVTDRLLNHAADGPALCPQVLPQNETEPPICDRALTSFADMTLEEEEEEEKDKDLASVSCEDVVEEIRAHLKEPAAVSIEHVHNDYSVYMSLCISVSAEDFPHVIEIYDFPPLFKTDDLLDAFAEYSDGGMKINWVDNTHALGVFSSESAAIQALSICHPMLKVRALAEGSRKAKAKAIRSAEFIQPVKERPRTDCAVAQRMVTRALGLQGRGKAQQ